MTALVTVMIHRNVSAHRFKHRFPSPAGAGRREYPRIARLLTQGRGCGSAEALRVRMAVETASLGIAAARNLLDRFRTMVAAKKTDDLPPWLWDAVGSELASFACGIGDDEAVVRAAIVEPWSNGQTE